MRLFVFLAAAFISVPVWSADEGCRRVSLDPHPRWVPQIVWSLDHKEVIAVDAIGGRLLRYGLDGRSVGTVMRPGRGSLNFSHPSLLLPHEGGYVLRDARSKLIWMDRSFEPIRAMDPRLEPVAPGFAFVDLTRPVLLDDRNEAVGLATYQTEDEAWHQAFARIGWPPLRVLEVVERIPRDSPADDLISMQRINLLTHVDSGVWALHYGEPSSLLRLWPEPKTLSTFPKGFETLPRLPESQGFATIPVRSKALERATVAVALYGRANALYLLTRRPRSEGGTLWQLHRIDPEEDVLRYSVELPTTAAEVVLAPGPELWAVLEKQSVTGPGEQEIPSMLLIPSPWIEDAASKALRGGKIAVCQ
jgi:hypothetical protein